MQAFFTNNKLSFRHTTALLCVKIFLLRKKAIQQYYWSIYWLGKNMCEDRQLIELDLRLHRIENQLLEAELTLEIALLRKEPNSSLKELILEIENIERKLRWFNSAIKRMQRLKTK